MRLQITPLGHATCLIEIGALRLITDPIFDAPKGLRGRFHVASLRRQPPPIPPEELPPVDAVLLSHAHNDHTDPYALTRLPDTAAAVFHRRNEDLAMRFRDRRCLQWGEQTVLSNASGDSVRVTAIAAGHYGARAIYDRWRGYGGFLLEVEGRPTASGGADAPWSMIFAGDTAQTDVYAKLNESRGRGVDLAVMPIGAYDPWVRNHCTPEQAWSMAMGDLKAEHFMPIHYDVFPLSREKVGEPLSRLRRTAKAHGGEDRVVGTQIGVPYQVS